MLRSIDERLSMHDFRVVDGGTADQPDFDVVVPFITTTMQSGS